MAYSIVCYDESGLPKGVTSKESIWEAIHSVKSSLPHCPMIRIFMDEGDASAPELLRKIRRYLAGYNIFVRCLHHVEYIQIDRKGGNDVLPM